MSAWVQGILDAARQTYGVNPAIFLVLFLGCGPVWYYSLFRLLKAVARKSGGRVGLWSAVFLASTAVPYLYVMIFGRNLPVWVYGILALLIGQGVVSLIKKLRPTTNGQGGKDNRAECDND